MDEINVSVDKAVEHFRNLLLEQIERENRMEKADAPKDFAAMEQITVGVCGGDGIGPIITRETMRVMDELLKEEIESGKIVIKNIEGLTIENREAKGKAVPDDVLAEIKTCDVL